MNKEYSSTEEVLLTSTKEGLETLLASEFTKGIGKVYAKKIVESFGQDILDPEFNMKDSLKEIAGLGDKKIEEFIESLKSIKVPLNLLAFLFSSGLKDYEVEKIVSHYGKRLEKVLKWDPYDMVENVFKLSFFTADKIGKYLGINADDPRRINGAVLTAVKFYAEEGNMFATEEQTLETASKIAGVTKEKIKPAIEKLIDNGRIIKSFEGLYLPVYYKAEQEAAEKIKTLIRNKNVSKDTFEIPAEDIYGNKLSTEQKNAIKTVLENKVTIITGGPGTGKTTTVRGIIKMLLEMDKKVVLAAPTGRAAKRMSELTGEEAKTIHRLLGYSMGRGYRNKQFDTDILVIDEASMLEQVLFNHLLQALKEETRIVLVGDTDQLPAIGAGNVLQDMIDSGEIPVIKLSENYRQKEGSLIAANAMAIKEGDDIEKNPGKDFIYVETSNSNVLKERILSLVEKEIPSYTGISAKDIQVVTPQQEGPLGAKQLNEDIQERVNSSSPGIKKGKKIFRLGDRVMQTVNSSERARYNGETGWISNLDEEKKVLEVTFSDGQTSSYNANELKELTLAYATTVHKLQGSETDYMVMPVTMMHKPMLYRNLLYTGVSRAKKLCVIVGESIALQTAIANESKKKRNSNFKLRLQS